MSDKRVKLSEEELKKANGGLIVRSGSTYWVVDDKTGVVLNKGGDPYDDVPKALADLFGVSKAVITPEEYEAQFGRKL